MPQSEQDASLVSAYQQMLTRAQTSQTDDKHAPLHQHLQSAQQQAVELGELNAEEAERISYYLRRDLHDAATFLSATEHALADWLKFDLEILESQFLALFSGMVDHTQQELDNLAERAKQASQWQSGEITAPGTLQCLSCQHTLQFHQPDYIPLCPNCGSNLFTRHDYTQLDAESDEA